MFISATCHDGGGYRPTEVAMVLGFLDSRQPLDEGLVYGVWFVGFCVFLGSLLSSLILAWAIKSRRP